MDLVSDFDFGRFCIEDNYMLIFNRCVCFFYSCKNICKCNCISFLNVIVECKNFVIVFFYDIVCVFVFKVFLVKKSFREIFKCSFYISVNESFVMFVLDMFMVVIDV